jgi:acetyltransferase-like isoleucine patch superfamily enzyme
MTKIAPTASIGVDVVLGANVCVGHNVVIHPGVQIGNNVTIWDNAVLGRKPQSAGNTARTFDWELPGLTIGDNCVVGACAVLYAGSIIENNVLIGDLASIRERCFIGAFSLIARCVTVNDGTKVGRRVKVMDNTHLTGNMVVEDDVFISVLVSTTNDNTLGEHVEGKVLKGPVLKRKCKVGASASILPGVVIGEQSVVGAGAVVTRDVPDRVLVLGVPARVVRSLQNGAD